MKERYNRYFNYLKEEFPYVDIDIIEKESKRCLEEKKSLQVAEDNIISKTGTIPTTQAVARGYYLTNGKIYSLNEATLFYKVNELLDIYKSKLGNYFMIKYKKADYPRLTDSNIEEIIDLKKEDVIEYLIAKNKVLLLATEFPREFRQLEEV